MNRLYSKGADSEHDELEVLEGPVTTPLPYRQVAVLCFMRITERRADLLVFATTHTEPISQSSFINQMLEDLHVTPDRTTNFGWATLSDRNGRKPILLSGLTVLAISMISLSLQTSFAGMVVARCVAGIMNGTSNSLWLTELDGR
ncbi:hypothetical protein PtA15_6A296 [Puccinia triticina]|uniref:Major facilitator superfamily (MFS) profile domain-containing protein n=1 Tax=Puccinia triticina TaxID=208348 RepID=A0ABY7CL63_9BASI|nr:uncharacterized protein PtA15_6A296 [Puccinia triticina]WAQ85668.1 hypothetical protein PtA15_6A296 [Puccinia triticina]WAR55547.1 hypothetical protein PtB15_6B288 [Puccinia triticina]